jgi:putative transcriptional regulator
MTLSLAPSLLISMPQLDDPNFHQTVILLCWHNPSGAFGVVVNRPLVTHGRVVVKLDPPVVTSRELKIWVGGPVEPHVSWILAGGQPGDEASGGSKITDTLYLSTSPDLLRKTLEAEAPEQMRLIVGYSGWGPGQLEAEIEASAWLIDEVDKDFIFCTPAEQMWEKALRRMGADPSALTTSHGVH